MNVEIKFDLKFEQSTPEIKFDSFTLNDHKRFKKDIFSIYEKFSSMQLNSMKLF